MKALCSGFCYQRYCLGVIVSQSARKALVRQAFFSQSTAFQLWHALCI
jgi:hypothetical protein